MPLLTKSKYLLGLQCPKLLWTTINDPEKIPKPDESTQHRFDEGHKVGELAKSLFPSGIDIPTDDFKGNISKTQELLAKRKPLFEPGFMSGSLFARADILNPVKGGQWDIIEVKSSTDVKDVYLHDLSFQKHCLECCGIKIRKCFLMHINNEYVRNGEIDAQAFFVSKDVTDDVEEAIVGIQERIEGMLGVMRLQKCPDAGISPNCSDPYDCALKDSCWSHIPANSVFDLYRIGKKAFELYNQGIVAIKDVPSGYKLNDKQVIQKQCEINGKPYIHKEGIKTFLKTLCHPLYFLDFETFNTAIPLYDGLRPYQQVPFQFSLHIVDGKEVHKCFLADGSCDPRIGFLKALKEVLGDKGSVVVYNQAFEQGRLRELGNTFPEYSEWVESVIARMVDLLIPFRNFHYYSPEQEGSASIKKVLPALTGKGYEGMEIGDGGSASLAYLDLMFGDLSNEEKDNIRLNLQDYCELDTNAMLMILNNLGRIL